MQDLTVTIVQDALDWEDPAANRARMQGHLDTLGATDVIVLAEMFSTGFTMTPENCPETMDGPTVDWMREQAARREAVVAGSVVIEEGGRYYNRFVWMPPDGRETCYDKRHRFALAGEHEHYEAGRERVLIEYGGWRVAPFVCYDLRFPVWCRFPATCDLMLFVANWPTPRRTAWSTLLRARATENQCYVAGVNRVGTDGAGKAYSGDSVVLDHFGAPLAECGGEVGTRTVTLSAGQLAEDRQTLPFFRDADRFELL